jgi:hypothetical protein
MKRLLFAAVAGVGLVSASPPDEEGEREARTGYPPCSASVTDECIQLYERGVRTRDNLADNRDSRRYGDESAHPSRHQPPTAAGGYPPCSSTVKDECQQRRVLARRVRMAGERG